MQEMCRKGQAMMSGMLEEDTHELLNEVDELWKSLAERKQNTPERGQRLNEPLERLSALIDANDADTFRRAALHLYSVMDAVAEEGGVRLTGAGGEKTTVPDRSTETVTPTNSMEAIAPNTNSVRNKLTTPPPPAPKNDAK